MQSVGVYMTDDELEALQALLLTDPESTERDNTHTTATKTPVVQREKTVEL
jgi:hypothetical protein